MLSWVIAKKNLKSKLKDSEHFDFLVSVDEISWNTFLLIFLTVVAGCGNGGGGSSQTLPAPVSMVVAQATTSSTGYLDIAACTSIVGWAWDPSQPDTAINVDIYDGSTKLATVTANTFRADLLAAGIGNGYHGYTYAPNFGDGAYAHNNGVYQRDINQPAQQPPGQQRLAQTPTEDTWTQLPAV